MCLMIACLMKEQVFSFYGIKERGLASATTEKLFCIELSCSYHYF
jgi:hypothetical protein